MAAPSRYILNGILHGVFSKLLAGVAAEAGYFGEHSHFYVVWYHASMTVRGRPTTEEAPNAATFPNVPIDLHICLCVREQITRRQWEAHYRNPLTTIEGFGITMEGQGGLLRLYGLVSIAVRLREEQDLILTW